MGREWCSQIYFHLVLESCSEMTSSSPLCSQSPDSSGMPGAPGMPLMLSGSPPTGEHEPLELLENKQSSFWAHQPRVLKPLRQQGQGWEPMGRGEGPRTGGGNVSTAWVFIRFQGPAPETGKQYSKKLSFQALCPFSPWLHGLDCSLTASMTLSRRTSVATHRVPSTTEEPAETHQIPGLDQNNNDYDNHNNVKDNNS